MDINFTNCNEVLNRLPISLYLGRDGISAEMDEKGEDSYYDPMADRIVISYPCVKRMLSYVKSTKELDGIVRGILYHEISHALLTPNNFMFSRRPPESDALNVFEDERIETVLHDFYYGVDFKRNVMLLNDYHGEEPKNAFGAFYHTVRYRTGEQKFLDRVNQLIFNFGAVKADDNRIVNNYETQILRLYYDITKDWLEKNEPEKLEQEAKDMMGIGDSDSSSGSGSSGSSGSSGFGDEDASSSEGEESGDSGSGISADGKSGKSSKPTYDGMSAPQKDEVVKRILEGEAEENNTYVGVGDGCPDGKPIEDGKSLGGAWHIPDYSDEVNAKADLDKLEQVSHNATDYLDKSKTQKMLDTLMNHFIDNELTNEIAMIFENFSSRNKNNSSALPRYSGILNPRAFLRDDWRIFEYKSTTGPVKGYDKLHLNLFIDTSGSYWNNEEKTNTILKSLTTLEEKYPFFYFDLVTMQRTETLRDKKERYIQASGGNDFDDKARDIYKQLQDPLSFNYNIVLFDGDAWTDAPRNQIEAHKKNMEIFNNSKTSIISDTDNQRAIEKYAPLSHHIFVGGCGSKSYSALLYDNILAVLTRALL